jgi:hypothetical protein
MAATIGVRSASSDDLLQCNLVQFITMRQLGLLK